MSRRGWYARHVSRRLGAIAVGILMAAGAVAADPGPSLFQTHETLVLTLEAQYSSLRRDRDETISQYRPAIVRYQTDDGETRSLALQLKTRGKFRLELKNCRFPAFMLRFAGIDTAGTPFAGQQEVPLVTHCQNSGLYEQYVLREYLAYRSYNLMTDNSLRVRLARISYVEAGGAPITTRYAFLLEHFDSVAQRLGAEIADADALDTMTSRGFDAGMLYVFKEPALSRQLLRDARVAQQDTKEDSRRLLVTESFAFREYPFRVDLSQSLQAKSADRLRLPSSPSEKQTNGVATSAERP